MVHLKLDRSTKLTTNEEWKYMSMVPYSSVVGRLMYAIVCSKHDLDQVVSIVNMFMSNPGKTK